MRPGAAWDVHGSLHLDEDFACNGRPKHARRAFAGADPNRLCNLITSLDNNIRARCKPASIHELQKCGLLINDSRHARRLAYRAIGEALHRLLVNLPAGGRNRIAMRIDFWMIEICVDPFKNLIRNGVLQFFSFHMNFRPVEIEHFDEKQLEQTMPSKDMQRKLFSTRSQSHAASRLVTDKPRIRQCFNHARGRAGHNAHDSRQPPHTDEPIGRIYLRQIDLLEIVFDRAARHRSDILWYPLTRKQVLVTVIMILISQNHL